jgi:hypothetical protein
MGEKAGCDDAHDCGRGIQARDESGIRIKMEQPGSLSATNPGLSHGWRTRLKTFSRLVKGNKNKKNGVSQP